MSITKSGMIAVVGRPNVGKSTLVNALAGEKVAIVTDKPQTTRNRICAVVNRNQTQMVFMDTPGFHKPRSRLGEYMVQVVNESVSDVDAAVLVVEPTDQIGKAEQLLLEKIAQGGFPCVLAINKTDTVKKEALLAVIARYSAALAFAAVVPISARTGEGLDGLLGELDALMPEGPQLFPDGMVSDQPERQLAAEIVREKLLMLLEREVPHGAAVEITAMDTREDGLITIEAVIYCEKESHKGIIIGKRGEMLRRAGELARADMEQLFDAKVYLQTWVKVKENWRNSAGQMRNFGYDL